jgi:hypothetical protein
LANLMERHGFRVTSIDTSSRYGRGEGLKRRLKFGLIRWLLRRFPHLAPTLVVRAEVPGS